jgi:hypothetical protein
VCEKDPCPQVEALETIESISPFYLYQASTPLKNGFPSWHFFLLLGLTAALIVVAAAGFERRDVRY